MTLPARLLPALLALGLAACAASVPIVPLAELDEGAPELRRVGDAGRAVAFTVEGPEDAPAVVLVHPWAGSGRVWDALLPAFTGARRVVRVDLPGHGRSDKPALSYTVERGADAVVAVMDALGVARADVVGNSLGGAVALAVVRDHPERVDRLVLIDALGGGAVPGVFASFIDTYFTPAAFHGVDDGLIELFARWFVFERRTIWNDRFLSR
ncbi:MAG: alpha/beta fold hydrolase, partial [Myxococcales bacterium]|nr:alpha/beta fold hydrolase [Myxococcales bacterium]